MKQTKVKADGDGTEINKKTSQEQGKEIIQRAISAPTGTGEMMEITVRNDDTDFTQRISASQFPDVIEPLYVEDAEAPNGNNQPPALPSDFFSRLTDRQEALFTVLADDGGMLRDSEIRDRIREEHGLSIKDTGTATGGIISGISRTFSEELKNNLFVVESTDEGIYSRKLADRYKDEITARLGSDTDE